MDLGPLPHGLRPLNSALPGACCSFSTQSSLGISLPVSRNGEGGGLVLSLPPETLAVLRGRSGRSGAPAREVAGGSRVQIAVCVSQSSREPHT